MAFYYHPQLTMFRDIVLQIFHSKPEGGALPAESKATNSPSHIKAPAPQPPAHMSTTHVTGKPAINSLILSQHQVRANSLHPTSVTCWV